MLQPYDVFPAQDKRIRLPGLRTHLEQGGAMTQNSWLSTLSSPDILCRCGHAASLHLHGKDCTAIIDSDKMRYCKCEEFRESKSNRGDNEMSKKEKKPKSEGRTPTLAPFVSEGFNIFAGKNGKYEARVRADGTVVFRDKEYTSPSSAGSAALGKDDKGKPRQVDGWKFWHFKK